MPREIAVEHEGKQLKFPVPDGFVHQDDLKDTHIPKDHFEGELTRRIQSVTKGLKKEEDLVGDPEFMKRYADAKKDDLRKLLEIPPGKNEGDILKIQTETMERIRKDEVTPLQTQIKSAGEEIGQLRVRDLDAQTIQTGAGLEVVPDLLDLVKIFVRERAGWDPERRQWFIKKEDGTEGFEFSTDPKKGGHPYMMVSEFLEKDKNSGKHKNWYQTGTQSGADFRGGRGSDNRTMNLEQFQKLSPTEKTQFYRDHPTEFTAFMNQIQAAGEEKLFARSAPALTR